MCHIKIQVFESSVAYATVNGVNHFDAVFSLTHVTHWRTCKECSKFIQKYLACGAMFPFAEKSWYDGKEVVMILMQQNIILFLAIDISLVNETVW